MIHPKGRRSRPGTFAKVVATVALLLFGPGSLFGQAEPTPNNTGTIAGQVRTAGTGAAVSGATVTVRGTTLATTTGMDGRYQIEGVPTGERIVSFSKSGFARATLSNVKVVAGQTTRANIDLEREYYEMETFEVVAEPYQQQLVDLLGDRKSAAAMMDVIGSEEFSRAGAGSAAEIMTKVTGASVVEGKYVYIRGLGGRYSDTTLNGASLPSADPDKKAVQLDMFPSDVIESIETKKTFTPDQPAGFSGGLVNIETKSFPDDFFLNFSVGSDYNTQSSFEEEFLTYEGGGFGPFGFDEGNREIPEEWARTRDTSSLLNKTRSGGDRSEEDRQQAAQELVDISDDFFPAMATKREDVSTGYDFAASMGNTREVLGNRLGYLAAFNYDRGFSFREEMFQGRYFNDATQNTLRPRLAVDEVKGTKSVNWGGLVDLSYELHTNHQVGLNFLFNRNAEDVARFQEGLIKNKEGRIFEQHVLHFTERQLHSVQFDGTHEFPRLADWKTEWKVSHANTTQEEPDHRIFSFDRNPETLKPNIDLSTELAPTRFFRNIQEENQNLKLDNTLPFTQWSGLEGEMNFGYYFSTSERTYRERRFEYRSTTGYKSFKESKDPNTFLDKETFTAAPPEFFGAYDLDKFIVEQPFNNYDGNQDINAGYLMTDTPLVNKLRFVGGARVETTNLEVENFGERTGTSSLQAVDILPASGLVYEVKTNMNVRAHFAQTLARPQFREIALVPRFDFVGGDILIGNPNLRNTHIDNYDLRWEWFPRPNEVFAASLFYKDLTNPIEKEVITVNNQVQFRNRDKAKVYGFELEARKSLDFIDPSLEHFQAEANLTYTESEVTASPLEFDTKRGNEVRPLAGQSPYLVNAGLTYDNPDIGTTASLQFNVFGERLVKTSRVTPSVFKQPVPKLNFTLSQALGKGLSIKFSAENLLNPVHEETIEFKDQEFVYQSFKRGRTFGLSLEYKF